MTYFIQKRKGKKFVSAYNGHYFVSANGKKQDIATLEEFRTLITNIDDSDIRVDFNNRTGFFNIYFPAFDIKYINYIRTRYGKANGIVFRLVRYGRHNNKRSNDAKNTYSKRFITRSSPNWPYQITRPNGCDGHYEKVEFFITPEEAAKGCKMIRKTDLNLSTYFKSSRTHYGAVVDYDINYYLFGFELSIKSGKNNEDPFKYTKETNMIKINPTTHDITT